MNAGIPLNEDRINMQTTLENMVLLLDDNEIQLMTRRTILRQAGYNVQAELKAANALAAVHEQNVGQHLKLIITDHLMPDMRGDAFIREVRKILPDVPVLVISGHPEVEQDYEGLNVKFLAKPCSPECLLAEAAQAYPPVLGRTA